MPKTPAAFSLRDELSRFWGGGDKTVKAGVPEKGSVLHNTVEVFKAAETKKATKATAKKRQLSSGRSSNASLSETKTPKTLSAPASRDCSLRGASRSSRSSSSRSCSSVSRSSRRWLSSGPVERGGTGVIYQGVDRMTRGGPVKAWSCGFLDETIAQEERRRVLSERRRGRAGRSRGSRSRSNPRTKESKASKESKTSGGAPAAQRKRGMWDLLPHQVANVDRSEQYVSLHTYKRRREIYVGNLPLDIKTGEYLAEVFRNMFFCLPEYGVRYPHLPDPVACVAFPDRGQGMFAFVEFSDEVTAATACLMNGFDLHGRVIKVGRPQHYIPSPGGEPAPMDVTPLVKTGVIPYVPAELSHNSLSVQQVHRFREVYFGNLAKDLVTESNLKELVDTACYELPEYKPEMGPPVARVQIGADKAFAFVTLQNPEVATQVIAIFDGTEFFGRCMKVGRPCGVQQYFDKGAIMSSPDTAAVALPPLPAPLLWEGSWANQQTKSEVASTFRGVDVAHSVPAATSGAQVPFDEALSNGSLAAAAVAKLQSQQT